jgi:hypothetical protein
VQLYWLEIESGQLTRTALLESVKRDHVLDKIDAGVRMYWMENDWLPQRASRKQIAGELAQIARSALRLWESMYFIRYEAFAALSAQLEKRHNSNINVANLCRDIKCLRSAAATYSPRGRPRKTAQQLYADRLVRIYIDATGTKPRRLYNSSRVGREERSPFFAACMAAVGIARYPAFIIRQAIRDN